MGTILTFYDKRNPARPEMQKGFFATYIQFYACLVLKFKQSSIHFYLCFYHSTQENRTQLTFNAIQYSNLTLVWVAIWKLRNIIQFISASFFWEEVEREMSHMCVFAFLLTLTVLGKFQKSLAIFSGLILKKVTNVKKANNLLQDNKPKKWGQSWITPNMACILYFMNMHVGSYIFWPRHFSHSPKNEVTPGPSQCHMPDAKADSERVCHIQLFAFGHQFEHLKLPSWHDFFNTNLSKC